MNKFEFTLSDKGSGTIGKKSEADLLQYLNNLKNDLKPRKIPPGSTQLYLIRCIVESMFQSKTKNKFKKEFDQHSLVLLEEFHKKSFYWSYLINFGGNIAVDYFS